MGVGINGGSAYGRDFSRIANEYLDLFDANPQKTDALLSHLNSGDYEPPDPEPPQPPPDEGETPEIPQEIRSGEKLGYYYLNPSVTAQTDIAVYEYLTGRAQHLLDSCDTTGLADCVLDEVEQFDDGYSWSFSCGSRYCTFDVDTKETIVVEDGIYEEHPLLVRFALDFS